MCVFPGAGEWDGSGGLEVYDAGGCAEGMLLFSIPGLGWMEIKSEPTK